MTTEYDEIQQDINQLHNAWLLFLHESWNGQASEVHQPPALTHACNKILEDLVKDYKVAVNSISDNNVPHDLFVHFGASMFVFGQRAARDGLLAANMLQCECGSITDEDLAKLSGEK